MGTGKKGILKKKVHGKNGNKATWKIPTYPCPPPPDHIIK